MFDLEQAMVRWRAAMTATGLTAPEILSELEEHLREDVARQLRAGVGAAEAFAAAVARMGEPTALKREFDLAVNTSAVGAFRQHRRKLFGCAGVGLLAAVALLMVRNPAYQSEAKFLIRYRAAEEAVSAPDAVAGVAGVARGDANRAAHSSGDFALQAAIVRQEVEILAGDELATHVARAIGPARILAKTGGGSDLQDAASTVRSGLTVQLYPRSNVIRLTFRHPDAALLQPVLREVLDQFLRTHVAMHRSERGEVATLSRVTNIAQLQSPSLPVFEYQQFFGLPTLLAVAGIGVGFAWVLAIRFFALSAGGSRRRVD